MAENKNIEEIKEEIQEELTDPAPANDNAAPAENEVKDTKTTVTVPKWLVKTARVIEGLAAAFGAVVAGLMIRDTVVKRKRKKHYIDAPVRREIPTYRSYENPTVPVSEDIKVDTF